MQCQWGLNNSDVAAFPFVKDSLNKNSSSVSTNGSSSHSSTSTSNTATATSGSALACAGTVVGAKWVNIKGCPPVLPWNNSTSSKGSPLDRLTVPSAAHLKRTFMVCFFDDHIHIHIHIHSRRCSLCQATASLTSQCSTRQSQRLAICVLALFDLSLSYCCATSGSPWTRKTTR